MQAYPDPEEKEYGDDRCARRHTPHITTPIIQQGWNSKGAFEYLLWLLAFGAYLAEYAPMLFNERRKTRG